jgi:hypothetical protein
MTRKETEYSDSSFCDCDCCKIWVRGVNFWEECPRLVFGVLVSSLHDFHYTGVRKQNSSLQRVDRDN